jgi:hypothetical protein
MIRANYLGDHSLVSTQALPFLPFPGSDRGDLHLIAEILALKPGVARNHPKNVLPPASSGM